MVTREPASTEERRRASRALLEELAQLGFRVSALGDLRRFGAKYATAIPALARALGAIEHAGVKEELAKLLAVPWAEPDGAAALVAEFRRTPNTAVTLKAALAQALGVLADDAHGAALLEFACDKRNGRARELIVIALAKLDCDEAFEALVELLDDPGVGGHALAALTSRVTRRRERVAPTLVKPFLRDGRAWVRRDAKALLLLIDELG